MKKITTSVALASLLATSSLVAEESGFFGGVNLGYGVARPSGAGIPGGSYGGFRYGLIGGYKEILSSNMGMRYYATLDFGTRYSKGNDSPDISTFNIYANGDALLNFGQDNTMEYGAFIGLALGYANHIVYANPGKSKPSGLDLAINLGVRAQSYNHHGLELYSRFGMFDQEVTAAGYTVKSSQPWQVGFRYLYTF